MIKRIGKCSFGFPGVTYEEVFEFPDNYTEDEMDKVFGGIEAINPKK